MAKARRPIEVILNSLTEIHGECRLWIGPLDKDGYGNFPLRGTTRTHVAAYEALVGPVPPGYQLHHTCENKPCWEPSHLEPLTPAEHRQRHRKALCKRGHPLDYQFSSGKRGCSICRRACTREWAASHPGKGAEAQRRYRARKKTTPNS